MCLCETRAQRGRVVFEGYRTEWKARLDRGGGGLCVLVRRDIAYSLLDLRSFPNAALEVLGVRIFTSLGILDIVDIYNPCLDVSFAEFTHLIDQLTPLNILIGDFNAHSCLWDRRGRTNVTGRNLECFLDLHSHGLLNEFYTPTYFHNATRTSSCLDLCFASLPLLSRGIFKVGADLGSDHLPIECSFGLSVQKTGGLGPSRWLVKNADWSGWCLQLVTSSFSCSVPDSAANLNDDLCSRILAAAEAHIPQSRGGGLRRRTPWWDAACAKAVAQRRRARNILSRSPTLANLISYKRYSAIAKRVILLKKRTSWRGYVSSLSVDTPSARVWRTIRSMNGICAHPHVPPIGGPEAPLALKAQLLLEHFIPLSLRTSTTHTEHVNDFVSRLRYSDVQESPYNVPFTDHELHQCVRSLRNTSAGHDKVINAFLSRLPISFCSQLLYLFNTSYFTGEVPDSWKIGIICPIPKPGRDHMAAAGYRPITLLSCIGKLMERMLQRRIEHFLESRSVLSCYQCGFRRGRSTTDALVLIKHCISSAYAGGKWCLVVFLDLAQAYDCVWHDGLLYKLVRLGCDLRTVLWLRSYLRDRIVKVRVGTSYSESRRLRQGLPQGAVLSPLLFNVMLHDLPSDPHVTVVTYADDITLLCAGNSVCEARHHLQRFLDTLTQWLSKWHFSINAAKSSYQVYSRRRYIPFVSLRLSGHLLSRVSEQRVLGIIFDAPRLTLSPHIHHVRAVCLRRLNVLRALSGIRWGSSQDLLRRVYVAFIRSKMLYGSVIFPEFSTTLFSKLCVVQNSALRCVLGVRKTTPILSMEVEAYIMPIPLAVQLAFLGWCLRQSCGPGGTSELAAAVCLFSRPPVGFFSSRRVFLQELTRVPSLKGSPSSYLSPVIPGSAFHSYISVSCPSFRSMPSSLAVNDQFDAFVESRYPRHVAIYTDGSRLASGSVSAAMYVPSLGFTTSWLLNPGHSILGAELYAILQALRFVHCDRRFFASPVVVFSDSMSALQVLMDTERPRCRALGIEIQSLLMSFTGRVLLQWVPAHCGIDGNEIADQCALMGHNNLRSALSPLTYEELVISLRSSFLTYWTSYWRDQVRRTGKGAFLCDLITSPSPRLVLNGIPRSLQCVVSRLRVGHAGVNSHLNRFNLHTTPLCTVCNVPETIAHFLLHCSRYTIQRQCLIAKLHALDVPFTLSGVLFAADHTVMVRQLVFRSLCSFLMSTNRVPSL